MGGAALGLAITAILLLVPTMGFLILPSLGFAIWAIALGARSLRSGEQEGTAASAVIAIVLGALALGVGLVGLLVLSVFGG